MALPKGVLVEAAETISVKLTPSLFNEFWALEVETVGANSDRDKLEFVAAMENATKKGRGWVLALNKAAAKYLFLDSYGAMSNSLDIWSDQASYGETGEKAKMRRTIKQARALRAKHTAEARALNEALLIEAAKRPDDLPEGVGIHVEASSTRIVARYTNGPDVTRKVRGRCYAAHADEMALGDCLDAFVVQGASARPSGYGPLLYDTAMEVATILGGGLTADRLVVSDEAYRVWSYYLRSRSDVKTRQLDVDTSYEDDSGTDMALGFTDADKLTPKNPRDDCMMYQAVQHNGKDRWAASPLAKVYWKKPTRLRELHKLGKLVVSAGPERSRIVMIARGH